MIPENDEERIKALRHYSGSLFADDGSLQNLVQLMAGSFHVTAAAISLVDREESCITSNTGTSAVLKLPRDVSLCSLTILSDEVTEFSNAKKEPLFYNNPWVHGEPGVTFYAGAPLITRDGFRIGTVCICDTKERTLTPDERQQLLRFARCVMHDLELKASLQKKTEGLEERELQLNQAYKLAQIGRWEFDVVTQEATWSDELFDLYGVDKSVAKEDLFSVYLSLIHPGDLAYVKRRAGDPSDEIEFRAERMIRPDGKLIYINQFKQNIYDSNGNLVKIIGISQDITERVNYEEKLKTTEERFKALMQNSSEMIAVLTAEGVITYISPTSYAISGYKPDELIGRSAFDFMHEEDLGELISELQKVTQFTNDGEPTLHRFRSKKGGWVWLESKAVNLVKDSQIGGIIINARDVTERVELEERLAIEQQNYQRAMTSAVIRAQENERSQLGRELHDNVNQVLTTIKLYMEMIYSGMIEDKELVRKSGQLLQNCIDEIRSISKRLSAPTLGEISLEDSIKELIESINLTNRLEIIYSGHEIAGLQIPQEMHLAIYRIIQEQLNNIIKYAAASLVFITLKKKNGYLSLHITDNGKGFDVNTKRTGIGITNMQTRAENLNGKFQLSSSPGNGCQLQVQFPLS
jgi:PAS domain S-box-containing protein